jgi:hypothetical protein
MCTAHKNSVPSCVLHIKSNVGNTEEVCGQLVLLSFWVMILWYGCCHFEWWLWYVCCHFEWRYFDTAVVISSDDTVITVADEEEFVSLLLGKVKIVRTARRSEQADMSTIPRWKGSDYCGDWLADNCPILLIESPSMPLVRKVNV